MSINITKKFDFIICNNFLEHQPKIKDFLEEINSMLTINGHIYFSVPSLKRIIEKRIRDNGKGLEHCFIYHFVKTK